MYHLPATATEIPAATGAGTGLSTWVGGVLLLGFRVDARVVMDVKEHYRREDAGVTAVTDPVLLDRLLSLPVSVPITDLALGGHMVGQPPGVVGLSENGATVTRMLRSPLSITDVVVSAVPGREMKVDR